MKLSTLTLLTLGFAASSALAGLTQWSHNGHWYERVDKLQVGGITWNDAKLEAESKGGYLVTITSGDENIFLTTTVGLGIEIDPFSQTAVPNMLHFHWLGGFQDPFNDPNPAANWKWVTGETFNYNNWAGPGEPNDYPPPEFAIVFDHGFSPDGKQWNDLNGAWRVDGYVMEYDSYPATVPDSGALFPLWFAVLGGFYFMHRRWHN